MSWKWRVIRILVVLATIKRANIACFLEKSLYNHVAKNQKGYAMKKGIHPEYHEINVTMTDGKTVKMYSSVKKDLVLSTDNLNHSAWTGQRANTGDRGQRAAEFKNKFAGFNF